jgi:hypothetical protein
MSTTYADVGAVPGAVPRPVPGDPDALELLARECHRTASGLRSDVDVVRRADRAACWTGPAATAYARSVRGLPRDLARAADSYDTVAVALTVYAAELRAVQATHRRTAAERDVLSECPEEQLSVRRRHAAMADDAELAAGTATCRVRSACDPPEEPPGFFERLLDDAGDWVEAHAGVLTDISFVLKSISTIAGSLALVPGLGPVAGPVAVASGAAALLVDLALATRGRASWVDVGIDATGAAIPGAGKLGRIAVREVRTRRGTVVTYRVEGTPNTRIGIDPEGNVSFSGRSMLYLNVGQRRRALDFYDQKVRGGLPEPQVKSFRIDKPALERLRSMTVEQTDDLARTSSHRVDTTLARDQFGLRRWDYRELEKSIVPGSGRIVR